MELAAFFDLFLKNEVNLNKSRLDKLNEKIEIINKFFKENDKFKTIYKGLLPQGSYAQQTIIKPPKDKDFDADILLSLKQVPGWEPKDYCDKVFNEFRNNDNYSDIVESPRTYCVRLNYKSDFHIDIVPLIERDEQFYIANTKFNKWEKTNPIEYTNWLNKKNEITENQLKKVIRMFKYLRDVKENFSVASILLSTLLGNCINDNENHSDFRSLSAAFITIFKRLNDFLQINTNKPIIKNPVLPEEDFSIHWDQDKYNNFRDKMNTYYIKSKNAFNETDKKKSIELWKEVFGDEFPDIIENDKIASSIVPVASTSKPWGQ